MKLAKLWRDLPHGVRFPVLFCISGAEVSAALILSSGFADKAHRVSYQDYAVIGAISGVISGAAAYAIIFGLSCLFPQRAHRGLQSFNHLMMSSLLLSLPFSIVVTAFLKSVQEIPVVLLTRTVGLVWGEPYTFLFWFMKCCSPVPVRNAQQQAVGAAVHRPRSATVITPVDPRATDQAAGSFLLIRQQKEAQPLLPT